MHDMFFKFYEIIRMFDKITLKKPKKVPKIPLFSTTNDIQTTFCINTINVKMIYHMQKYVVIKMGKFGEFMI